MDNHYNNIEEQEAPLSNVVPVPFDNKDGVSWKSPFKSVLRTKTNLNQALHDTKKKEKLQGQPICLPPFLVQVKVDSKNKQSGVKFQGDTHVSGFTIDDAEHWIAEMENNHPYSHAVLKAKQVEIDENEFYKDLKLNFENESLNHSANNTAESQKAKENAQKKLETFATGKWRDFLKTVIMENKFFNQSVELTMTNESKITPSQWNDKIKKFKRKRMAAIRSDKCWLVGWVEYFMRLLFCAEDGFCWCTFYACIRTLWYFALFVVGPLAICYFMPRKFMPAGNDFLSCVNQLLGHCGMHDLGIWFAEENEDSAIAHQLKAY